MPKNKPEQRKFKFSKVTRQRMSQAHTGKRLSEETKRKISQARQEREALIMMGLLKPFRHTEATKRKLSRMAKQRKHKPSKAAREKSRISRKNRALDKSIERKAAKANR